MRALKTPFTVAVMSWVMLFAQPSFAQEASPATTQERTAEQWVDVGTKAYQDRQYAKALTAFSTAQKMNKSSDLYYNIGRVHESLNQPKLAIDAYRKFVVSPDANIDARADALKRIKVLEGVIGVQNSVEKAPAKTVVEKKPTVVKAPPVVKRSRGPHPMSWVLLGTGVVSVGLGGYFAIQSNSAQSLAESKCQESGNGLICPESAQANWDKMKTNALIADIAFVTGGALLVGSLVTFVVTSGSETAQVQVTPVMTKSSAFLRLQTSF